MLGSFKASSIECLQNILNDEKRKEKERQRLNQRKKVNSNETSFHLYLRIGTSHFHI